MNKEVKFDLIILTSTVFSVVLVLLILLGFEGVQVLDMYIEPIVFTTWILAPIIAVVFGFRAYSQQF